jgi:hypothetical protein
MSGSWGRDIHDQMRPPYRQKSTICNSDYTFNASEDPDFFFLFLTTLVRIIRMAYNKNKLSRPLGGDGSCVAEGCG